jgi:AcrR family transcriptional regulator
MPVPSAPAQVSADRMGHRLPQGEMRQRILDVAMEFFLDRGYGSTSIRDIAEKLDISKAAVYYHFPAKQSLAAALLAPAIENLADIADQLVAKDLTPAQAFEQLSVSHNSFGVVMAAMRQDPSLREAAHDTHVELFGQFNRMAKALAGPRPSRARLIRAHASMGALLAGLGGAGKNLSGPSTRADRDAAVAAALAALG